MTDADPRDLEAVAINVIRGLAMDAPEQARSGHQGTAMALAPLAHVLFSRILEHDPEHPDWPDRDRFILSAGHASILLYSMLHLCGYDLSLDDLRAFRQWDSRTPGHPETGHTPGVEVTTGPLGQGLANAVGMAIAEARLREQFGDELIDHRTYAVCSDGDLMEGVSHEAASLAGHLLLGRLICIYDDNRITIDGTTDLALSDDAAARFGSYGWHVINLGEASEDLAAIEGALRAAIAADDRPSLVIVRSHVGYPSPRWTDSPKAHGNPFDAEEIAATKKIMGLPANETFWVPDEVREMYRSACLRGRNARQAWETRLAGWSGDRAEWQASLDARGLQGWSTKLPTWTAGEKLATRVASNRCLEAIVDVVPGLVSGGADLTGNSGTALSSATSFSASDRGGRQIAFGVREHAMGAVMNGMALHGGVTPVGGTFLVFSDYMRPAVRLAALSRAKVVYSFSHDSVGVGEDGPTHQPIEHVASLRSIPGLRVIRPADANETARAWQIALDGDGPTALILTRQDVPVLDGTQDAPVDRGAYVLVEVDGQPDIILIGTGSEVYLCVDAARALAATGTAARVVSMPSWDLFEAAGVKWQAEVLPAGVPRLSIEAGATFGWARWSDDAIGINRFGASAPGAETLQRLGITTDHIVHRATSLLATGV